MRRFQLLDLIERLRAAVSDIVVRGDVAHEETANVDVHTDELNADVEVSVSAANVILDNRQRCLIVNPKRNGLQWRVSCPNRRR